MGKDEKERNKNYRSILFRSNPMRNRKFHKNSKKFNKKKKEIRLWFISSQNRSEKDEKYGKKKNYRFVSFLPNEQKKIPKKIKKLKNTIVDSFQAKID